MDVLGHASSGIFQKVNLNAGNCMGNQMPNNQNDYFENNPVERTLIESWILGGCGERLIVHTRFTMLSHEPRTLRGPFLYDRRR